MRVQTLSVWYAGISVSWGPGPTPSGPRRDWRTRPDHAPHTDTQYPAGRDRHYCNPVCLYKIAPPPTHTHLLMALQTAHSCGGMPTLPLVLVASLQRGANESSKVDCDGAHPHHDKRPSLGVGVGKELQDGMVEGGVVLWLPWKLKSQLKVEGDWRKHS